MSQNASQVIRDFLDLLEKSREEYEDAKNKVEAYNANTYTWTHRLEDCQNRDERNRLATAWQRELKQRRVEKDRKVFWEKIYHFASDASNKAMIKRIKYLLQEQEKVEEYVSTPYEAREYKKASAQI